MGRRLGQAVRLPRLRGDRHDELRLRGHARPGRRRRDRATRRSPTPPTSPRATAAAGERRPRGLLRRRSGRRGGDDPRWPSTPAPPGASVEDYTGRRHDLSTVGPPPSGWPPRSRPRRPVGLVLTARAENLIRGVHDLADTIARLQAYQEAGADVLYAPGLFTIDDVRPSSTSVDRRSTCCCCRAARRRRARRRRRRPAVGRRHAGLGRWGAVAEAARELLPTAPGYGSAGRASGRAGREVARRACGATPASVSRPLPFARLACAHGRVQDGEQHDADGDHAERQVGRVLARRAPDRARTPTAAPSTPTGSARCGGGRGRGSSGGGGGGPCRRRRAPCAASPGGRWRTAGRASGTPRMNSGMTSGARKKYVWPTKRWSGSARPPTTLVDTAISRPSSSAPLSPMKIRAGLKLCGRKPTHRPTAMIAIERADVGLASADRGR